MVIAAEIGRVEREFVPGQVLFIAVMKQEGLNALQTASWFLRNIAQLNAIPMLEFNVELRDFRLIERPWASDIFRDITVPPLDENDAVSWCEWGDGYEGGWLSSDLKGFFSTVGLVYPQLQVDTIVANGAGEDLQIGNAKTGAGKPLDAFLARRGYDFIALEVWLKTFGTDSDLSKIGLAIRFAFIELCGFIPLYYLDTALDATLPMRLTTPDASATWSELLVSFVDNEIPDAFFGNRATDSLRWCMDIFMKTSDCAQFEQKSGLGTGFFKGAAGEIENGELDLAAARVKIRTSELSERDTAQTKPINNEPRGLGDKELGPRERETLLNIIGVMLELLQSPKPGRNSDAAVMKEMIENYGEKPGIKKRTLEEKFPAAKRSLTAE